MLRELWDDKGKGIPMNAGGRYRHPGGGELVYAWYPHNLDSLKKKEKKYLRLDAYTLPVFWGAK